MTNVFKTCNRWEVMADWVLIKAWTSYIGVNLALLVAIIYFYKQDNPIIMSLFCIAELFMLSLMFYATKIKAWLNKRMIEVMIGK